VPGPDRVPAELHVLRSDRMALVPGPDGWPVAYDYAVGGRTHRFP
jgi:phage portal protein BeeE